MHTYCIVRIKVSHPENSRNLRDHPLMGGSTKFILNCTWGEGGHAKRYILITGPKSLSKIMFFYINFPV